MADTPTFLLETDGVAPTAAAGGGIAASLAALALPLLLFGLFAGIAPLPAASPCPVCTTPSPTICTTPTPCSPTPTCPGGFMQLSSGGVNVPNKCYFFSMALQSYYGNQQTCTSLGGHLAAPQTIPEGAALATYLKNNDPTTAYYIGFTDFVEAAPVRGVTGGVTPIPGLGAPPAPANNARECVTVTSGAAIALANTDCTEAVTRKAICEIDLSKQTCVCP